MQPLKAAHVKANRISVRGWAVWTSSVRRKSHQTFADLFDVGSINVTKIHFHIKE